MPFPHTRNRPIVVDLFAGAGGLSLGFEQAGFEVAAAVEYDPIHCAVHEFNFPGSSIICASAQDITGEEIREQAGLEDRDIDVVVGGPPCQGFSLMGKRRLDDERNNLIFEFVRLVLELNPKHVMMENVPGILAGDHRKILDKAIELLESSGYQVRKSVRTLDARDYGVPQARKRVFILASREDCPLVDYPKPSHYHSDTPEEAHRARIKGATPTVADAIGDLPDCDQYEELFDRDWAVIGEQWDSNTSYAAQLRGIATKPDDYSHPRRSPKDLLTSSMRTRHTDVSKKRFENTEPGKVEKVSRFPRLNPDGYAPTLRAGTGSNRGAFTAPRPIHPEHPRVITVREAARLHSYPDFFRFHRTKFAGFRAVGNSVPPLLAKAVAESIMSEIMPLENREKPQLLVEVESGALRLLEMSPREAAEYYDVPHDVVGKRVRSSA